MYENLENLDICLTNEKRAILSKFSDFFLEYNKKINLISRKETDFLYEKHIFDSLSINLFLKKYFTKSKLNLLDLGTGGGFPALPCALLFDYVDVTCVDSINKKIKFIVETASFLGIKNIHPQCSRIEDLDKNMRNSFDVVTSRAMAELRIILEYAIPFVKTGGYFVAFKSNKAEEEIKNAQSALIVLNTKLIDTIEYSLPIEDNPKRVLLIFKKQKDTPLMYPRKNISIKNKPL